MTRKLGAYYLVHATFTQYVQWKFDLTKIRKLKATHDMFSRNNEFRIHYSLVTNLCQYWLWSFKSESTQDFCLNMNINVLKKHYNILKWIDGKHSKMLILNLKHLILQPFNQKNVPVRKNLVQIFLLKYGFHKKSFFFNATLVSCPFPSSPLGMEMGNWPGLHSK